MVERGPVVAFVVLCLAAACGAPGGTTRSPSVPPSVGASSSAPAILSDVAALAAGEAHTCAVLRDGRVMCWGDNDRGQLGDGTTAERAGPVLVEGLTSVVGLAAGAASTCALSGDGTVACWGVNGIGQLGNGTTTDSSRPVAVAGLADVTSLAAGSNRTCAVQRDGTVSCWGELAGRLPGDSLSDELDPVRIKGLEQVTALAVGISHTCALLEGGTVACAGGNDYGQVGNGTTVRAAGLTNVDGLAPVSAITAAGAHTCALLREGTVACWGQNAFGAVGDGSTIDRSRPVLIDGLRGVASVAAGSNHTCAVVGAGSLACWGWNHKGALGNGSTTDADQPTTIPGLTGVIAVAAGEDHTCALLSGGGVDCWGGNDHGQLGDGTTADRWVPSSAVQPSPSSFGESLAAAVVAKFRADPLVLHCDYQLDVGVDGSAGSQSMSMTADFTDQGLHLVATTTAGGQIVTTEIVRLGNAEYLRTGDEPWQTAVVDRTSDSVQDAFRLIEDRRLLGYVGVENVEGRELHHLRATGHVPYRNPSASVAYEAWDIWVETDGTPVLARMTLTVTNGDGSTAAGSEVYRFSNFGTDIEIKAPSIKP